MNNLIAKIGKGQRGSKDLTWEEAREAAAAMIEGQATPFQTGAFLMAMRIKMEAMEKIASSSMAMRSLGSRGSAITVPVR